MKQNPFLSTARIQRKLTINELYKDYARKPSEEIDPNLELPDFIRDDIDLSYMSSKIGLPHILGIIDGKVHFGSASEGNIFIPPSSNIPEKEKNSINGELLKQKESLLKKFRDRIIPEKPKKKHIVTIQEKSKPFHPPIRMDEKVCPNNIEKKFWLKDLWG